MAGLANVFSESVGSTGEVISTPARLRGVHFRSTATAGTIVLKDGVDGATKLTIYTPALAEGDDVSIPDPGMWFAQTVYAVMTNVDGLTLFYQEA